jgi:Phosphotransferase enzyme family
VFSHLDAVPDNVIVRDGRTTLIDWAFAGYAAPGEELAALVGGSTIFGGDTPPSELASLDATAFPAYVAGLRDSGSDGNVAAVRFAYCAATALRFCVAPAAFFVRGINPDGSIADGLGIRDPAQRAFLEAFFDRAFEDLLDTFAMTFAFAESLGREALQLLNLRELGTST